MAVKQRQVTVVITMGDPSGIGPETAAKACVRPLPGARYLVVGDKRVFEKAAAIAKCRVSPKVGFIDLANVRMRGFRWGKVSAEYGCASMQYLDVALDIVDHHGFSCLVTGPISKESIHLAGYGFPGHTEYLARHAHVRQPAMMLVNRALKTVLATRHIPLKKVPAALNVKELADTIIQACLGMRELFGVSKPRVAVCGLNPHASDNGVIGDEEARIIFPAVRRAARRFAGVKGPLPADSALSKACTGHFDCVVVMYHDQALVPLKVLDSASGVNITLGLPFVRTSPLHGTAFDIAGRGIADHRSFSAAIETAAACARNAAGRGKR